MKTIEVPKFKIGQQVCLANHQGEPFKLLTVTKLNKTKTKIALSDGSSWNTQGSQPYGRREKYYCGPSIREVQPADDEKIRTRDLARWIAICPWDDLPLETLREIHKILRPIMDAKGLIKSAGSINGKSGE